MNLHQLLRIGRRWWWLLLLAPLICGTVAYSVGNRQLPLYSATVVLKINPPVGPSGGYSALQFAQNLTETYRREIVMSPVLDQVINQLGLPYDSDDLERKSSSTAVTDTQLIRLSVSDTDPDQAALIANTIANTFIAKLNGETTARFTAIQGALREQTDTIQTELDAIEAEIARLDTMQNADDAAVQDQLASLRIQMGQLQQQLTDLQLQSRSIGTDLVTSQTQVTISDPAIPPRVPYAPRVLFNSVLAAIVGFLIAAGAVALLQFLDNTVQGTTDIRALTGGSLLATIATLPKLKPGVDQLYVVSHPRSPAAEAIRLLRANLDFAAVVQPITSLAVSSTGPGEGKSTVTANLAVVMAQAGFSVVVIDADLRNPSQHQIFGVPNDRGLTTLLLQPETRWQDFGARVSATGLMLIPSGPIPPNPADLLSIDRLPVLLSQISKEADIVLLDTPPILTVSDPLLIGAKTDGMLLLTRAGHTRRDRLQMGVMTLQQAGIRLIGVVINQQSSRSGEPYYTYGNYGESSPKPASTHAEGAGR